jgi:hypothetical protein
MNQMERDQIIENDLGWARSIKVSEIDGKLMMGNNGAPLPFNVSHVMKEEEFVKKWMLAFAVGNRLGVNYFNQGEWFSFSYGGTRAVLIVGLNPATGVYDPIFIVPPLTTVNLTKEDREKLRLAAGVMYANSEDASKKNDINANLSVANTLADERIGLEAQPMEMSDLVRADFFAKYNIVPEVERGVYFVRDVVRGAEVKDDNGRVIRPGLETSLADLDKTRSILHREHFGKQVTKEEYKFLNELSLGWFDISNKVGVDYITDGGDNLDTPVNKETQQVQSTTPAVPDSPFEC